MSRSKRFATGVFASYLNIGANIIYGLASIPIALHFLNKELFGLWALAAQIGIYLSLLEAGVSIAIYRCLADHKDDVNGSDFGEHLGSGAIIFLIQGVIIAIAGLAFSFIAPFIFSIPEGLQSDFRQLIVCITAISGTTS